MSEILWASFFLSAATYLAACLLFVAQSRRRATTHVGLGPRWARDCLCIGALLHLSYLVLYALVDRRCPVFSLHSALGFVSLVGVVTYVVLGRARHLEAIGGFVAATAAMFMVAARLIAEQVPEPNDRWLMAIHITSNLLGGGILLVAGCASAFYLWNEHRLKSRKLLKQPQTASPRSPRCRGAPATLDRTTAAHRRDADGPARDQAR